LCFDLFSGFLLCIPRGFIFYANVMGVVIFHMSNKLLFNIGIFPVVMLASTLLFFESDWPTNVLQTFKVGVTRAKLKRFSGPLTFKQKVISGFLSHLNVN
jgi:hypothetical protein